jgi:hypothetical protein
MTRSTTFVLTVNVPANAPAFKPLTMTITPVESGVSYSEYLAERSFLIEDAYIRESGDAGLDGYLRVIKNRETVMGVSRNVKGLVVTNPAKPLAWDEMLAFRKGDILVVEFLPASSPSEARTVTVFLAVSLLEEDEVFF